MAYNSFVSAVSVATFESTEAWTGGSGAADTTFFTQGTQSWRLGSAGTFNSSTLTPGSPYDLSTIGQYIEIDVHVEDITKLEGVSVIAEKDVTGSNYARFDVVAADLIDGWNRVYFNKADMTLAGTFVASNWSSIARLRVGVDSLPAQTTYCSFDDWQIHKHKPHVLIEFDDGLITVYSKAMAIVESYGFYLGAFLLSTSLQNSGNYELWANLRLMQDRGHVIGFHYHADADYSDNTLAEIRADMDAGKLAMANEGLDNSHYGSSQGKVDEDIDQAQRERFYTGRRDAYPQDFGDHDLPLTDLYTIWGHMIVNATSLPTFQGWVDTLIAQERGTCFVWHNLDPVADPTNGVSAAMFDSQISYLSTKVAGGLLDVITRNDLAVGAPETATLVVSNERMDDAQVM